MKRKLATFFLILLVPAVLYGAYSNELSRVIDPTTVLNNSANDMFIRTGGLIIEKSANITGTGSVTANVLQFTGSIVILNQWAEITSVTTLTNLTGMYATAYDGTNSVELTDDGAVLSGAPVGTFWTKDKIAAEIYSVNSSDQVRLLETLGDRKAGRPFILTAKDGVDNFIRLHYTTTDNPVDFDVFIRFEYVPLDGGTLEFL